MSTVLKKELTAFSVNALFIDLELCCNPQLVFLLVILIETIVTKLGAVEILFF